MGWWKLRSCSAQIIQYDEECASWENLGKHGERQKDIGIFILNIVMAKIDFFVALTYSSTFVNEVIHSVNILRLKVLILPYD